MKKLFLTAVMAIVMATPVHAACEGGTLSDDGQFCISDISLNWWSAANWCKANGRHLATMYEACPDWDGNTGGGKCPVFASFTGSHFSVWVTIAKDSGSAFGVVPYTGDVYYYNRNQALRALCK